MTPTNRYIPMSALHAALCAALFFLAFATQTRAQSSFVDDAQRSVALPHSINRVFAAGAPAEVLLYTLAPEKLVGRNHMPMPAALPFMPPTLRSPVQIMRLPDADDADNDAELLALKPDIYIDYGDVTADYVNSVINVQQRTGIPGIILDGGIEHIAATYRKLGAALGIEHRGELLARQTERILSKYRGSLQRSATTPRVYLACSASGNIPCLEGERNGEVVKLLGAINVAGTLDSAPRRPVTIEEIKAWNPDVIIASSAEAAVRIASDAEWQSIPAVAAHRVFAPPSVPFNWGPRPPSVNRLMGLIWLAYVLPGRPFDAAFFSDTSDFFRHFYHVTLSDAQLHSVVGVNN